MDTQDLARFLQNAAALPYREDTRRRRLFAATADKNAAVLTAFVFTDRAWHILLTKRADTLRHHRGQIAFPGGRIDAADTGAKAAALRETLEETGIPPHHWQTFPALPPLYTPSGYRVTPIPALCPGNPPVCPNPDKVAEILYLPLGAAFDTAAYQNRNVPHRGQTFQTLQLPFSGYDIWGLTALILHGLAARYALWRRQHTAPAFSDGTVPRQQVRSGGTP